MFSSMSFLKLIFIGIYLLYSVVLISTIQQSESAIHIHLSLLFWISFPFSSMGFIFLALACKPLMDFELIFLWILFVYNNIKWIMKINNIIINIKWIFAWIYYLYGYYMR